MNNSLIGQSGFHPWDAPTTHEFQHTIKSTYCIPSIDYNWWVNGTNSEGWDGPRFYDEVYRLNKDHNMILTFGDIPEDKFVEFVQMITKRYPTWGVSPICEIEDPVKSSKIIKQFRAALPEVRLVGPNLMNDYTPGYMDYLVSTGAMGCLDVVSMHDYFACPGNGSAPKAPWDKLPYFHPNASVNGYPNLLGRIRWMESYVKHLRQSTFAGPKVILTEYGIYNVNVDDAKQAALVSKFTGVPLILSTPHSPNTIYPYSNGVWDLTTMIPSWSLPIQEYLKTMDFSDEKVKSEMLIYFPDIIPPKKRTWWQQILFKLFGLYKK